MPDPAVDVLTCPECRNVIRTERTVDRNGDTQITCPSCKKQSPLYVFRTSKTKSLADSETIKRRAQWQSPILVAIVWFAALPLFLGSAFAIFLAFGTVVNRQTYGFTASMNDVYDKLTIATALLQMLVFGKLLNWTFNLLRRNQF